MQEITLSVWCPTWNR